MRRDKPDADNYAARNNVHTCVWMICDFSQIRIDLFTMSKSVRLTLAGSLPMTPLGAMKHGIFRREAVYRAPHLTTPFSIPKNGGGERDRTDDLLLAKQALSQLSYTPFSTRGKVLASARKMVGQGGLEPPTSRLSSARSNQLSY